jgi:hypothetical protein
MVLLTVDPVVHPHHNVDPMSRRSGKLTVVHSTSDSADGSDDASGVTLPVINTDAAASLAEDAPAVLNFV